MMLKYFETITITSNHKKDPQAQQGLNFNCKISRIMVNVLTNLMEL